MQILHSDSHVLYKSTKEVMMLMVNVTNASVNNPMKYLSGHALAVYEIARFMLMDLEELYRCNHRKRMPPPNRSWLLSSW